MLSVAALVPLLVVSHGAYPLAYQLLERSGHPGELAAGTTFGLLLSHDDGGSWGWVCEEAVGYGSGLKPVWYLAPEGTLFGAGFNGLYVSHDQGCTWGTTPEFADAGAADIADNGTALFAVSQKYGSLNGIWRSMDRGASWQPTPISSTTEFYTTVRAAPTRPQRVYVASWWYTPSSTEALYWSDDNGDTFTRIDESPRLPAVPQADGGLAPMAGALHVFAVGPTDPDVVWAVLWQSADPEPSYVVKSSDKGETWSLLLTSPDQIGSLALSDDGSKVWAGSAIHLYASVNGGSAFAPLSAPIKNSCAFHDGDRLYACGWPEVDGFSIGKATQDGTAFAPFLTWGGITGAASCPVDSRVSSICAAFFPALRATFPPSTLGDAGPDDGSDGGSMNPPHQGCHCSQAGSAPLALLWVLVRGLRGRKKR